MPNQLRLSITGILLIAVITSALYIPFLGNTLVFDDKGVFGLRLYDHAQAVTFAPRSFPYFTLGLVQVLTGSIAINRLASLVLHVLNAVLIFALIKSLLHQVLPISSSASKIAKDRYFQICVIGVVIAMWFAMNPVAVYGAAYLAQRTILFATLFSLLSLWFYLRAFRNDRTVDVITAALFYSAAVLSKEHAILLPLAVVPFGMLYIQDLRLEKKRIALYLVLCIPAGVTALIASKSVIGSAYEPDAVVLISQLSELSLLNHHLGKWFVSIVTQAGLFFHYIFYWAIPDTSSMSADMRIDFTAFWSVWVIAKAIFFVLAPIFCIYCIRASRAFRLFGCGLLYCWVLFFTELVSVRIQEPFVLYRSYLWAPGYAMMLAAACTALSIRWVFISSISVFLLFFVLSRDRLASFTDEGSLWKDAAAKLESESVLGSERIFYNRGLQYMREGKFEQAISDFSRAASRAPNIYHIFYQRGIAYYSISDFEKALADFNHALSLTKIDGALFYAQGLALEKLKFDMDALKAYTTSADLGFYPAKLRVTLLTREK